jgi:hypothetical protein
LPDCQSTAGEVTLVANFLQESFVKLIVATLITLFSLNAHAASESKQTIGDFIKRKNLRHTGGYFAPVLKSTTIQNSKGSYTAGAKVAAIFNNSLMFGVGGYKNLTDLTALVGHEIRNFGLGYAGGFASFTMFPKKLVNITGTINYNFGTIVLSNLEDQGTENTTDNFEMIEPEITAGVNLSNTIRIAFGVGIQKFKQLDNNHVTETDLNSLSSTFSIEVIED